MKHFGFKFLVITSEKERGRNTWAIKVETLNCISLHTFFYHHDLLFSMKKLRNYNREIELSELLNSIVKKFFSDLRLHIHFGK